MYRNSHHSALDQGFPTWGTRIGGGTGGLGPFTFISGGLAPPLLNVEFCLNKFGSIVKVNR